MSTNRKPGIKASSAGKEKEIKRPALKLFLEELKSKIILEQEGTIINNWENNPCECRNKAVK